MFFHCVLAFWIPFFSSAQEEPAKYSVAPVPAWVKSIDFPLDPPVKPSQIDIQPLLDETQVHVEEESHYFRVVRKILTPTGARSLTQMQATFDPSFQRSAIHILRIWREGEAHDLLASLSPKLIQQEEKLEQNLYSGKQTLVYFLGDVRVGDIIEFSGSIMGRQPISPKYVDMISLQDPVAVEKIYYRLLANPQRRIQFKNFHTSLEPNICDLSADLREWSWEVLDATPCPEEKDEPYWYDSYAHVLASEYQSWKEVVELMIPLYALPADFIPSEEMVAFVQKWRELKADPKEQALLALRFVQDGVKYLGFTEGTGAYQPSDPNVILAQRFGDCKNKTMLLKTLLNLIGIEADAVLVHSKKGTKLPQQLPAFQKFDHVVLRISIDGEYYFVDPTFAQQKGPLQDNFFPEYHWGLVIAPGTTDLIALPAVELKNPREIYEDVRFLSPTIAELKIMETLHGNEAEKARQAIAQTNLEQLSKESLEEVQNTYKGAKETAPIVISDDLESNTLKIEKNYQISTRARPGKRFLKVISSVHKEVLDDGINLERTAPYALKHPVWIKEHIHIENPLMEWESEEESFEDTLESVQYAYQMKREGHTADFTYELKHLKDHVPVNEIEEYWNFIAEVESHSSQELMIAPAGLPPKSMP